jgi:hypothetical protein
MYTLHTLAHSRHVYICSAPRLSKEGPFPRPDRRQRISLFQDCAQRAHITLGNGVRMVY